MSSLSEYSGRRRPAIIFFFGSNGAGKSTQMDLLLRALKRRNLKAHKSWVASHHLFAWFLGVTLAKLGYPQDHWTTVNPHLHPFADFRVLADSMREPSKSLLMIFEIFNLVVADLFKVRMPKLLRYWVVVEKYIPVTIADFHIIFDRQFSDSLMTRFLLRLVPRDAYGIFLDINYESLLKRRGRKTEPRKYLELQNVVGKWYAKHYHCLIIDTSKTDIQRAHELIMNYLGLA